MLFPIATSLRAVTIRYQFGIRSSGADPLRYAVVSSCYLIVSSCIILYIALKYTRLEQYFLTKPCTVSTYYYYIFIYTLCTIEQYYSSSFHNTVLLFIFNGLSYTTNTGIHHLQKVAATRTLENFHIHYCLHMIVTEMFHKMVIDNAGLKNEFAPNISSSRI